MSSFKQNCSLCEECQNLSEMKTNSLSESVVLKLCEFIVITSIVTALHLLDILICSEFKVDELKLSTIKKESRRLINVLTLSLLILSLPFVTMLVALALLYKIICSVAIKRKDKRFVKFLDSLDVFYCLEDKTTTDIQGVIQSNTIEQAVDNIKEKLRNVFTHHGTDKIFYRRNEDYGFYYWRRYSAIDLAQYVQTVEVPQILGEIDEQNRKYKNFANLVSYNDEGLFKVLIVKNTHVCIAKDGYKIILQFHHSVKGSAQLEFVARLVEKANDCQVNFDSSNESQDYDSPDALMNMITKPCCILMRSFDDNSKTVPLQDNVLTRLNAIDWTKSDENLLCKVNDARKNVCGLFR